MSRFFLITNFALLLLAFSCHQKSQDPPAIPNQAIARNNEGVALMGRFDYAAAEACFSGLVAQYPDWQLARVNLGIATLNLQQEGSEDRALSLFETVLNQEPNNLPAKFCTGLLHLYKGDADKAVDYFRQVLESDPNDAYAAYYLGQCAARAGNHEEAYNWYQKASSLNGYLRSAYYGLFQACQRLGKRDEAREMLNIFQSMKDNPQARQVEFKYTRMGPKADASVGDQDDREAVAALQGPLFGSLKNLELPEGYAWNPRAEKQSGLVVADLNSDGHLDILAASAVLKGSEHEARCGFFSGDGQGGFQFEPSHLLLQQTKVNTAVVGDFDQDGLSDVYLLCQGPNRLFKQHLAGQWQDVTGTSKADGGNLNSVDGLFLDADHDGDLDLFVVNADGPNELWNNNLDGTFRPLAADYGLAGSSPASQMVVATDLDSDRDLDLLVINQQPPHEVYLNDRLWQYRPATGFELLTQSTIASLMAADMDVDGYPELYGLNGEGAVQGWHREKDGSWITKTLSHAPQGLHGLAFLDVTGRGLGELLSMDNLQVHVFRDSPGEISLREAMNVEKHPLQWKPVQLSQGKGPSLLLRLSDGTLAILPPGPGRYPFITVSFSGKSTEDQSLRSNTSGLGTTFAARNGTRWLAGTTLRSHSGPGAGLQPVNIGLAGKDRLDFLSMTWSDGVFQTEMNLAAGPPHRIEETQRQLSSCPVLFAWDGSKFSFISDILGVGGMGFNLGFGEYAGSRPWENFLLPPGALGEQDDFLKIKITEPMEESAYLDHISLAAWDLPPGWQMVPDERMGTGDPQPTGAPFFFQEEILPITAVDGNGRDVLASVSTADLKAAPVPPADPRFIGLLEQEHVLTLTFPASINHGNGQPVLMIDGWLEYPYSQTCFSAWQAGKSFTPPTLDIRLANGSWQPFLPQFGYPAGMPRRMSLPLDNLPVGVTAVRLRTNQEIYWDRIALIYAKECPQAQRFSTELLSAELKAEGFAKRTTGPQRLPHYDDTYRLPLWDTRHQQGFYTQLGEVTPLLIARDDALAIIGPGEGITFTFAKPDHNPLPGWRRFWMVEAFGWCKDMDLYTKDGETLGPLPESGFPQQVRNKLHAQFNTRFRAGY